MCSILLLFLKHLKPQQPIKCKLLISIYSQLCEVQYGEIGRWSLVWVKVCLTTNSPSTVYTFSLRQVDGELRAGYWGLKGYGWNVIHMYDSTELRYIPTLILWFSGKNSERHWKYANKLTCADNRVPQSALRSKWIKKVCINVMALQGVLKGPTKP